MIAVGTVGNLRVGLGTSRLRASVTYYWDANGTTAGFGASGTGTWGSSAFISTDATGASATANITTTDRDTLNFGTASAGFSSASTVTVSGTQRIQNITMGAGNTQQLNITGGALAFGSGATITNNSAVGLVSATPFTAGGLTKTGTGTVQLMVPGTGGLATVISGPITVAAGTLFIADGYSHINSTGPITVASGAALSFSQNSVGGNNLTNNLTISGSGVGTSGAFNIDGNSTATGTITLAGAATISHAFNNGTISGTIATNGNALTLATVVASQPGLQVPGVISGAGSVTINGAANSGNFSVLLSGANTYSGGTSINAGNLSANHSSALGTGTVTIRNSGTFLTLGGASGTNIANAIVLDANGTSGTGIITNVVNTFAATVSGPISIIRATSVGGHFFGGGGANDLILSGTITATSGITLVQRGGLVAYSGAGSSFDTLLTTGNTVCTVKIGADNGLATNALLDIPNSGAMQTLNLNGFNQSLRGVSTSSFALATDSIITNGVANTRTLTLTSATATFGGIIQNGAGTVALVIAGANQTLSGPNTYTGTTTVSAGTLTINGSLGATAITISGTAMLGAPTSGSGTAALGGSLASGASSRFRFPSTASAISKFTVAGATTFSGGFCDFPAGVTTNGTYDLIVSTGTMSGTLPAIGTNSTGKTLSAPFRVGNTLRVTVS